MKKRMKQSVRLLSVILTLGMIMATWSTQVEAATLTQEEAAKKGAEVYEAWAMANDPHYQYLINDFTSPSRSYVEDLEAQPTWNGTLVAWRIATFDVKSELNYNVTKETAYYNAFLFNILYDETTQSIGSSFVKYIADESGDIEKMANQLKASTMAKLLEKNPAIVGAFDDPDKASDLIKELGKVSDIQEAMEIIGDVGKYMGYCETGAEVVEKVAQIEALLQQSDEVAQVIYDMKEYAVDDVILQACLEDYYEMLSGTFSEEWIAAIFAGQAVMTEIAEEMASCLWKAVIKLCGVEYISYSQTISKFATDMLFNTSGTIEGYYKLRAMCNFEDAIKQVTLDYQQAFELNPTPETAKKFIAAYKLYHKTLIENCDCATEFVNAASKDGAWNLAIDRINDTRVQTSLRSIKYIKEGILAVLDYTDTLYYDDYLDMLSMMDEDISSVTELEKLPEVDTDPVPVLAAIKVNDNRVTNWTINESLTLTEDMETYGKLYVKSGIKLDLNGHTLAVGEDAEIYGDIDLNNGILVINGNVLQGSGTINFHKGTMRVGGNCECVGEETKLIMEDAEDELCVGGDFFSQIYYYAYYGNRGYTADSHIMTAGTIKFEGNVETNNCDIQATGTHKIVFNGMGEQRICLGNRSYFNEVDIQNTNVIIEKIGMTKLVADSECKSDSGLIWSGRTGFDLNGKKLKINGGVTIYSQQPIDLNYGEIHVTGDVRHEQGTITFNKGALHIDGDYRIQRQQLKYVGVWEYIDSYGKLVMECDEDELVVGGNFYSYYSYGYHDMSAGTAKFAGDVTDYSSDIRASGTHKTVLNGAGKQVVTFSDTSSTFNILQLTKDIGNYTFTPNPCWKELIEYTSEILVESVALDRTELEVMQGESVTLTATIMPDNATNQEISWTSDGSDIAEVDQTGKVTGKAPGVAVVTVMTTDGGKTADCMITVKDNGMVNPTKITITFDPNDGTVLSAVEATKEVTVGESYGTLPTPKREGYTFGGWYTALENGTQVTDETIVKTDTDHTLYAYWTEGTQDPEKSVNPAKVTVTFDLNGGTALSATETTKEVTVGELYGTLPHPTQEGYTFEGWYTAAAGGTQVTADVVVVAEVNHVLYAHWAKTEEPKQDVPAVADKYLVIFYADNAEISRETVLSGETLINIPQMDDNFIGWYDDATNKLWNPTMPVVQNMGLYARFKAVEQSEEQAESGRNPSPKVVYVAEEEHIYMVKGQNYALEASGSDNKALIWKISSGGANVIKISSKYKAKALAATNPKIALDGDTGVYVYCGESETNYDKRYIVHVIDPYMVSAAGVGTAANQEKIGKTLILLAGTKQKLGLAADGVRDWEDYYAVTWTSSNEEVAKVDDGTVWTYGKGSAKITAYVGGRAYVCTIKVVDALTPGKLADHADVTLSPLQVVTLKFADTVFKMKNVSWDNAEHSIAVSKNKKGAVQFYQDDVVRVTPSGKLTAVGVGTTILTATSADKNTTKTITVTVSKPAESILYLNTGKTKTLKFYKVKASKVEWKLASSKMESFVGNVDKGKVKGVTVGIVRVTGVYAPYSYTDENGRVWGAGITYTATVYVENPKLKEKSGVAVTNGAGTSGKLTLSKGGTAVIKVDGVYQPVIFASSKPEVAFVDEAGILNAYSAGKTTLTARVNGKKLTIVVTIQ